MVVASNGIADSERFSGMSLDVYLVLFGGFLYLLILCLVFCCHLLAYVDPEAVLPVFRFKVYGR